MANSTYNNGTSAHRSGWVAFAAYMLIIAGIFQTIVGLVAIFEPDLYVVTDTSLWLMSFDQWGWTHFILGLIMASGGASLLSGKMWGRIVAVVLATISAIANFAFIWAYPIWSILIIALDVMIIYSVVMHGGRDRD